MRIPIAIALSLAACAEVPYEPNAEGGFVPLSARRQLIRLSVDLRGIHPSEAELKAVEFNPALYEDFTDRWLHDPRFSERMREVFNYRWLMRSGDTYFDPGEAGLGALPEHRVAASIGDEPLRLLSHIVENDLSYDEIVLADYTMSDPIVDAMWNLDYPDWQREWAPAHYLDGRPHAGILTMETVWQRYPSMEQNANRHRANAISRMLLCDDYLSRPIAFSRSSVDLLTQSPENAIRVTPACQTCHSTLDPLAAPLFGFFRYDPEAPLREATLYRQENEWLWRAYADRPPAYYGQPVANIRELAEQIAQDRRFAQCAVRTVFEGFTQRPPDDRDWEELIHHEEAFEASGRNLRELVRSIVSSAAYRAGAVVNPFAAERIPTVKTVSPSQLAGIIEDLTGYRWRFDGADGLTTNVRGLPVLAGGIDSRFVTERSYAPPVGLVFLQERLAQGAGWHVAVHDLEPGRWEEPILLSKVAAEDTPETAAARFEAQIRELYLTVTGLALEQDAPEIPELMAMWKQLHSVHASSAAAWAGVISAVLRDPMVTFY